MLANNLTGTGENYGVLTTPQKQLLTLGDITCTDKSINVNGDLWHIESTENDKRVTYGFVNVAYSGAVLRMSN